MKTHDCQECVSHRWGWKGRGPHPITLICEKGHKPRFFLPRDPLDANCGWKRRCEDFTPRPECE